MRRNSTNDIVQSSWQGHYESSSSYIILKVAATILNLLKTHTFNVVLDIKLKSCMQIMMVILSVP